MGRLSRRTEASYRRFCEAVREYDTDPRIEALHGFRHHRGVDVYDHVRHVAWVCWRMAGRLPAGLDVDSLLRIAFLHDYFMYDRTGMFSRRCHGYIHPVIAAENARRDFGISDREYMAVVTHMWPEVFWCVPGSREAWLLCLADKICAIQEYMGSVGRWSRRKIETTGEEVDGSRKGGTVQPKGIEVYVGDHEEDQRAGAGDGGPDGRRDPGQDGELPAGG